jgi:two-component system sensor histidine kinase UhpB
VRKLRSLQGTEAERDWLIVKFPLTDPNGGPGVGGIAIDISERVQAEELARRYAAEIRSLMNRLVATREMERRRLADELHDLIGQNLTALGIELAALDAGLPKESRAGSAPRLEDMRGLLAETVAAIRGVMTDLRPPALEEYGLVAAMRSHALEHTQRTGMKVSVGGPAELRLVRETELVLFRIFQEALTNATKHSGGSLVQASICAVDGATRLVVEDDGRGFADPLGARREQRGGWGLRAMRERAQAHGGALRIECPGRGTRLVVEIPDRAD